MKNWRQPSSVRVRQTSPTNARDELILRILFALGTQATETVNLRWSDITKTESGFRVHIRRETAKGKKERWIAVGQKLIDLLEQLKPLQPESDWLFPSMRDPNKHIARGTLWKLCSRAGQAVNLKTWPHLMRHARVASLCVNQRSQVGSKHPWACRHLDDDEFVRSRRFE